VSRTFRLTLEYDGTDFAGWQAQAAATRTVQGVLEAALEQVTGSRVAVTGASRTDAGVHAEGQVASLASATRLEASELRRALDAVLPRDLGVRAVAEVAEGFHARRDARAKRYRYAVWNGRDRSPLRARHFHHVRAALDLHAMRAAAARVIGTHDFRSFQTGSAEWLAEGRAEGRERSTVRTVLSVDLRGEAGGELRLEVRGSGFLRHMVRTLAGTLLEVGRGRREPASLGSVLDARDRKAAGPTAPALGLTLVEVEYDPREDAPASGESGGIPGR